MISIRELNANKTFKKRLVEHSFRMLDDSESGFVNFDELINLMITFARDIGVGSYSRESVSKAIEKIEFENLRRIEFRDFERAFQTLIDFLENEQLIKNLNRISEGYRRGQGLHKDLPER